jgi:hypothetical protein
MAMSISMSLASLVNPNHNGVTTSTTWSDDRNAGSALISSPFMRDPSNIRSKESYDAVIATHAVWIEKRQRAIAEGIKNASYAGQYAFQGFLYAFESLWCMYSRGDAVADLRACLAEVVEIQAWAYDVELRCYPPETMETRKRFRLNFNIYLYALWLMSFAICLELDDVHVAQLLQTLGNEGEDALFDWLAASRAPARRVGTELLYPKLTKTLYDAIAIDAPGPQRDTLLAKYVSQWYGKMKEAIWHDAHLRHDADSYYGYWCFEVAGVVKAFGIDDRAIRDLRYYPSDLAR